MSREGAARRAKLGARAEAIAERHLGVLGLVVLDRNVRVGRLEIDLLARDDRVVVLVEVRTRGTRSWQRALDSIDPRKQARLRAAAERIWRERFANDADYDRLRFDAVTVTFGADDTATIEHVRAFLVL